MHRRGRSITCSVVALVVVALVSIATSLAAAQQATVILQQLAGLDALTSGATVHTRVILGEVQRTSDQGLWLAGFSAAPGGAPTALAVTLSRVGGGWLGSLWGVQLISDQGLLPARLAPQPGNHFTAGSMYVALQTAALTWEHEYDVMLGYDPQTGRASVSIYDVTAGTYVISRNLQLEPYAGPLHAAAGVGTVGAPDEPPIGRIERLSVEAGVRPARLSWWIMQRERPEVPYTTTQRIDRRLETVVSARLPWDDAAGSLSLHLIDEAGTVRTVNGVGLEEYVPVPVRDLPAGLYRAVLEYARDGVTWTLGEQSITVGVVRVAVDQAEVGEVEPAAARRYPVQGVLRLESDGPLGEATVGVSARLVRHTFVHDADGRRGRTEKAYVGDPLVIDAFGVQPDGVAVLPFGGSVDVPLIDETDGWELELTPFALPESYMAPADVYDVWVARTQTGVPWLGFLDEEEAEVVEWVPGVHVVTMRGRLPAGPLEMYLVAIDLTRPELSLDALIGSQMISEAARWPRDQVGTMVANAGALMGINAAFFDIRNTQNPNGLVIQSGKLLKSGATTAVAIDKNGVPHIGAWQWVGSVQRPDGTAVRTVVGLNETNMSAGIGLYRWPAIKTPGTESPAAVELVLANVTEWDDPDAFTRHVRGVVAEVRQNQPPVMLQPGIAVLGGSGANGQFLIENYKIGDEVEIVYRLVGASEGMPLEDWRDIWAAVSGGVILLRRGVIGDTQVLTNLDRHPRTAVGFSEDRTVMYWLVVDGRSTRSVGMTYMDMAQYFQYIGAHYAINLDGGGSSTLAAWDFDQRRVTILNVPSDGSQRYVPDGLALFYKPD